MLKKTFLQLCCTGDMDFFCLLEMTPEGGGDVSTGLMTGSEGRGGGILKEVYSFIIADCI